jgi:hypothetical protein
VFFNSFDGDAWYFSLFLSQGCPHKVSMLSYNFVIEMQVLINYLKDRWTWSIEILCIVNIFYNKKLERIKLFLKIIF